MKKSKKSKNIHKQAEKKILEEKLEDILTDKLERKLKFLENLLNTKPGSLKKYHEN